MRTARADYAATVPWSGIIGRPEGPDGTTSAAWGHIVGNISDQTDLTILLNRKANSSSIARVGFTGNYNDLSGLPMLRSGAFAPVTDFATAAQGMLADSATQPGDNVSTLTNDADYQSGTEVDATVAAAVAGYVPTTRTVNGHALSADVTVTKGDVGLGSVENTALSTWAGSTNITILGVIAAGLQTAAPVTGTAGVWKLGIRVAAAVVLDTTQYIQLDVGGTLYKLAVAT